MNFIKNFLREEEGATAIEYGLLAALISVVIIGAVTVAGHQVCLTFDTVAVALGGTATGCP